MSETKQNSNAVETQPLIIVKQKSALVGFLLAFIGLGWFGIDRFYKGDIMLGLFKLFCPILALIAWGVGYPTAALVIIAIGCFFWLLDWILVPLGISRDNTKKLAQANGTALAPNNQASNSSTQPNVKNTNQKTKKMIFISLVVIVFAQIWISIWFLSANSISVDDKKLLAQIVFIVALIVGFALIYYFAWRYARQNKSVNNVAFIAFAIAFILIFVEFIAGRLGTSVVLSCLFYISELCNCLSSFYFAYHDVYDFYNYSPHIGLLVNIPNIIFIIIMVIWFNKFDKSKKSSI